MANHEIKEPKVFSQDLRRFETTDRAHAALFNSVMEVLINNDAFLYSLVEAFTNRMTQELSGKVPITRKVNNKALSGDITLSAGDVSAIPANTKGVAGGVAELDSTGKVLAAQLPSFVDDVIDGYLSSGKMYKEAAHNTLIVGEAGKIYIDLHTSKTYRWSGTAYAVISDTVALGETSSTAYRGDRGKIAYDHSQAAHAPANAEQNVQSDWNVTDTGSDAYIKNKPSTMRGASASAAGGSGFVPAPGAGAANRYLRSDGSWSVPPDNNTIYTHPTSAGNKHIPAGGATGQFLKWSAAGTAVWSSLINNLLATVAGNPLDATQGKILNDKITELNSKLSYTTWSSGKKIPFGNVNGNNSLFVELVKLGKVVSCQIVCTIQTTAANTSFTLSEITIPTGYRPARNVYVSYAGNTGANMSGTGRWEICTDGSLKMIGSTAVFSERHASIAWITI